MRPAVRDAFIPFTSKFEGVCDFPYLDVRGLVTTAIGVLIDPIELAMPVPWCIEAGGGLYPAAQHEIVTAWHVVKERQDMSHMGGMAFKSLTNLRLTASGVEHVTLSKLEQMEIHLRRRFPSYEVWPADAQLALLSMAWAAGPAFHAPKFDLAVGALDFATAAAECHFDDTHNPGLHPRNLANRQLFENAARSIELALDPNQLIYPGHAEPDMPLPFIGNSEPPTAPSGQYPNNLTEALEAAIAEDQKKDPNR